MHWEFEAPKIETAWAITYDNIRNQLFSRNQLNEYAKAAHTEKFWDQMISPMSAIICTLLWHDWQPVHPTSWIPKGAGGPVDATVPIHQRMMLSSLTGVLSDALWKESTHGDKLEEL